MTQTLIASICADAQATTARLGSTFGSRLPHVRTQAGLSQNALADRMGTKRSTVGRIESGESVPLLRTMQRIVTALEPLVDVAPLIEVMTPEQTNLAAQVTALARELDKMTVRYSAATTRNEEMRREIDQLRDQSRSESPTITLEGISDDDEPFPNIDPELVALRRLIKRLRGEDYEAYAPAICWALNNVKTITVGLADATGQHRRIGRRAA